MELLTELLMYVLTIAVGGVILYASYCSMLERDEVKRGWREGRNDYYGNKLENEDD